MGFPAFSPSLATSSNGFHGGYFSDLAPLEAAHFWFRARNRLVISSLERYFPNCTSFLEIGCGTGFVLSGIRAARPDLRLAGSDVFCEGLDFARQRLPGVDLFQMDACDIPFEREFDVVGAFDVLEHIDNDQQALREIYRSLQPGGGVLITVPQHRFLWSAIDDYSYHKRRYSREELRSKLEAAGFRVRRLTSFVSLLLPALLMSRLRRTSANLDPLAELRIGRFTNAALGAIMSLERGLIYSGMNLPAGGSLLAVATKEAA